MPKLDIVLKDHEFAKLTLLAEEQHRSACQQAEVLVIEGLHLSLKGAPLPATKAKPSPAKHGPMPVPVEG